MVVVLGTVPLVLMQTIINRTVQENLLKNTTILTQGILDQSQQHINLLLLDLDTSINRIINDSELKSQLEREGLSIETLKKLEEIKDNNGIISSLVLVDIDPEKESVLFSLNTLKYRILDKVSKKNFLDSQQASLLKENNDRILWLGSPPNGINDAIPSIWTYRILKTETSTYIIAGSLDREKLLAFISSIGASARSDVLLITTDNIVYPYDDQFFNYSFTARALQRSSEGRYNIIYDERETPEGHEKLMIQVYTDPLFFYNLLIITPQGTLLRGFESIVRTANFTLLFLAIGSISLGLLLVYFLHRRIQTFIVAVHKIGEGLYDFRIPGKALMIQEDISLTRAITEMSSEIENSRNMLKYANENLEKIVSERTHELQKSLNELHMTRQSLIHSEKMADLGRQGAKTAHEINNPLSVAITAISHLASTEREINKHFQENKLTKSEFSSLISTAEEVSEIVMRNLKHATDLTTGFKNFASDQSREEEKEIRLENYINEIIKSFSYKLKRTPFSIEFNCSKDLEILTDPSIIYQTMTNLINNSLLHGFNEKKEGLITINIEEKDNCIIIVYTDDGNGISKENLSQLYKPFFTTKADQGGTGLGLNIIKDLIEEKLNGTIECSSKLGHGTKFIISFPVKRKPT